MTYLSKSDMKLNDEAFYQKYSEFVKTMKKPLYVVDFLFAIVGFFTLIWLALIMAGTHTLQSGHFLFSHFNPSFHYLIVFYVSGILSIILWLFHLKLSYGHRTFRLEFFVGLIFYVSVILSYMVIWGLVLNNDGYFSIQTLFKDNPSLNDILLFGSINAHYNYINDALLVQTNKVLIPLIIVAGLYVLISSVYAISYLRTNFYDYVYYAGTLENDVVLDEVAHTESFANWNKYASRAWAIKTNKKAELRKQQSNAKMQQAINGYFAKWEGDENIDIKTSPFSNWEQDSQNIKTNTYDRHEGYFENKEANIQPTRTQKPETLQITPQIIEPQIIEPQNTQSTSDVSKPNTIAIKDQDGRNINITINITKD